MIHALVLLAAMANPSPSPTPVATFAPAPLPTAGPELNLATAQFNASQIGTAHWDLLGALLGTYCAPYGGLAAGGGLNADGKTYVMAQMLAQFPPQVPFVFDCVKARLSVTAAGKVTATK